MIIALIIFSLKHWCVSIDDIGAQPHNPIRAPQDGVVAKTVSATTVTALEEIMAQEEHMMNRNSNESGSGYCGSTAIAESRSDSDLKQGVEEAVIRNNCTGKSSLAEENDEKERVEEDVCRDFMNNMCNRGSRCKFYHPPNIARQRASQQTPEGIEYQFCIDYQNRGCHRDNCRYVHAHREDVDRYKLTGEVTLNLAREIAAVYNCDTINGIPFCREYQTGSCSRGSQRCRYWHINVEEERERRRRVPRAAASLPPPLVGGSSLGSSYGTCACRRSHPCGATATAIDGCLVYGKRMRHDFDDDYVRELERRNAELSKEVEGLKREIMRERERYEDLYVLFREHANTAIAVSATTQQDHATTVPAASAYYQSPSTTSWCDSHWTR